jgi:hypothetical protein
MCTLKLTDGFPVQRVCAWFAAFRALNAGAFAQLHRDAVAALSQLKKNKGLGPNGKHFIDTALDEWLLTCGDEGAGSLANVGHRWRGRAE